MRDNENLLVKKLFALIERRMLSWHDINVGMNQRITEKEMKQQHVLAFSKNLFYLLNCHLSFQSTWNLINTFLSLTI
jgi:hypothetical protein